jgi:hypothetical protein
MLERTSRRLEPSPMQASTGIHQLDELEHTIELERIHVAELTARQNQKRKEIFLFLLGLEILKDHGVD